MYMLLKTKVRVGKISPDLTRNVPEKLKSSGGPITQDNTGVEYTVHFSLVENQI